MITSVTHYQKQVATTMKTTATTAFNTTKVNSMDTSSRRKPTTSIETMPDNKDVTIGAIFRIFILIIQNVAGARIVSLIAILILLCYHVWNISAMFVASPSGNFLAPSSQSKTQYHGYIDALQNFITSSNFDIRSRHEKAEPRSDNAHRNTVGELIEETGFYQSIRLTDEAPLIQVQSPYQLIEVRRSPYYGKVLILDGVMQLTERDADSYNEMMAHVPMFQHHAPKNVLIIGGGDGYVLSEVLKHSTVEHVDHVDLDGEVINVCKQYFSWSKGWDDPRVHLHVADGATFIANAPDRFYDVIIQDSSDPWTWSPNGQKIVLPSSVLYSEQHFQHISRSLKNDGILVIQAESLQIPSDFNGIREWRNLALRAGFHKVQYGTIMISSYPTGQIGMLMCEKNSLNSSNLEDIEERYRNDIIIKNQFTTYYHPLLHLSTFTSIPKWAYQHIYGDIVDTTPTCLAPSL